MEIAKRTQALERLRGPYYRVRKEEFQKALEDNEKHHFRAPPLGSKVHELLESAESKIKGSLSKKVTKHIKKVVNPETGQLQRREEMEGEQLSPEAAAAREREKQRDELLKYLSNLSGKAKSQYKGMEAMRERDIRRMKRDHEFQKRMSAMPEVRDQMEEDLATEWAMKNLREFRRNLEGIYPDFA